MTTMTPESTMSPLVTMTTAFGEVSERTGFPIEMIVVGLSLLTVLVLTVAPHRVGLF